MRLEFLGHHRFDGIGSKMRRRGVQQGGIVDVDSCGRNGVAKTNIDLDSDPRAGDRCGRADTHATIFHVLPNRRRCQRGDIKRHTVISNRLRTNGPEGFGNGLGVVVPVAKQIQITSGPERVIAPGHEEHCAFEDEAVAMR